MLTGLGRGRKLMFFFSGFWQGERLGEYSFCQQGFGLNSSDVNTPNQSVINELWRNGGQCFFVTSGFRTGTFISDALFGNFRPFRNITGIYSI